MRNLFLALVLANLAFAAWHFWFAEPDAPASRAATGTATITLVDELDEADIDEASAQTCISIGTFAERSQADAAAASLRMLGFEAAVAEPADVDAAGAEPADPDVTGVEPADPTDPADADTASVAPTDSADSADSVPADPADPDAPFWIDVTMDLRAIEEAGQPQPLGLGLVPPTDDDASDAPASVTNLTLRACDSATD